MPVDQQMEQEVTYITPEGAVKVRMIDGHPGTITSAAESLKARYVIAAFDRTADRVPIWSVYDMTKVTTRVPGGGPSLPLPMRHFVAETSDAAVMYALAVTGRC